MDKKPSPASLHQLMFVLQHLTDELLESNAGVGLSQVRIMAVLSKSVPHSQRTVAMRLRQTEANVSRQLQAMKRRSLVSVRQNKKDKRLKEVLLTSKGSNVNVKAQRLLNAQQKDLLKLLSAKERKSFERATNNLIKSL